MAFVFGNIGTKASIEFRPVSVAPSGFVKYLPEPATQTFTNRRGDFSVEIPERLYEYSVGGRRQFIIRVPSGSVSRNVDSLIHRRFEDIPGADDLHDHPFVAIAGGTMTGALILSEHPDEDDSELQAATKGFVEAEIAEHGQVQFHQSTPDYVWRFEHNLGKYPSITTTLDNPAGQEFLADNRYINENVIEIRLNQPLTGTITLNF